MKVKIIIIIGSLTLVTGYFLQRGKRYRTHYRFKYHREISWREGMKLICARTIHGANIELDNWFIQQRLKFPGSRWINTFNTEETEESCNTL